MAKLDFGIYPKPVREKLLTLRQMIFDVAKTTPGVGKLERNDSRRNRIRHC
jgi:hypothetical protein